MKITKSLYLVVFFLLAKLGAYGQQSSIGLCFYSHNDNIDKRTSLILNNNEPYKLDEHDNFSVEFDIFIRNEKIKFGYIFRIISNKEENFDFIIKNDLNGFFVINNRDFPLKNHFILEQWNHVKIVFQKKTGIISFQFNDETINCPYDLKGLKALIVNFGLCDIQKFLSTDVAPFILKNIRVFSNNKALHHWVMDKHGENVVYDELRKQPAIAVNPYWIIDNSIYWKKEIEFQTSVFPQIAFDSIHNNIYILNPGELIIYSLLTHSTERIKNIPETQDKYYNHLLFDPLYHRLLSYNLESEQIYYYDFDHKIWSGYLTDEKEPAHAHHNRYISKNDTSLYLFGGYGFYKYNSDFFKINLKTNERTIHDFSHTIIPRYLSAMGGNASGDKIYILGGRGAEMGRQELSPKNFSDLFEINLKTLKAKYLFDIDKEGDRGDIYSNSLVVDSEDKNIYVLAYPNKKYTSSISLKMINLEKQSVETLADSIEFYFQDISSFCDLYYSPQLSKFVAVAAYSKDQLVPPNIYIYTLDYPPLKEQEVMQSELNQKDNVKYTIISAIIITLLLISLLFVFLKKLKEKRRAIKNFNRINNLEAIEEMLKGKPYYNTKRKSILLLGGFEVFNKDGKNITLEFTPILKHMLILIILHTMNNNKGIASPKLEELIWLNRTNTSARNNRTVNMSKLRTLLNELGNINITNQNSYWTITLPDDVLLDYKEALKLIVKIQNDIITKKDNLLRLLELLNYGNLLPNIQLDWADSFKTDFSNTATDTLMNVINNEKNSFYNDLSIRLKIADSLLKIDSLNEDAIEIKCKTLIKMGKKGLAKIVFDNFSKEYKHLFGETYPGSIKNFLEK
jgi:DNA-binding SARP family transcriptional activator